MMKKRVGSFTLALAKGLVDASYQPENDILFIAHGSEEWGASGTQFDWTTGAWEMINNAHPDWAGKTLAAMLTPTPASSSCWPRPQPPRPRPRRLWQNSWPHKVCSLQFAPAALYCG